MMSTENDKNLLNTLCYERNLSKQTFFGYKRAVNLYTNFNNKSLNDLFIEAENEAEKVSWKKSKLKNRLINFRRYLYQNYSSSTANSYFMKIKTIYFHFDFEIHRLPSFSKKNVNETAPITYEDLPTKREIQDALKITNPLFRAIILFMLSSGCSKKETLNLKIIDFIKATKDYHEETDIYKVIDLLKHKNNIISTFKLRRQKTNKYYYTFTTPEATNALIYYLISRKDTLKPESKLFRINDYYINNNLKEINDQLKLGTAAGYARLRPHMLRKYHASHLHMGNYPLSLDQIDSLQGRSKTLTRESYYLENTQNLKKVYIKNMEELIINN